MKIIINRILSIFNFQLVRLSSIMELIEIRNKSDFNPAVIDLHFIKELPKEKVLRVLDYVACSKSQINQDLFVLSYLDFKTHGYFVEFGATNGVDLSNTWLLEKKFNWNGILAEPAKCWHESLAKNRSVIIENKCVWTITGSKLLFNEVNNAELSTIDTFSNKDLHSKQRKTGSNYEVETISLYDLLEKNNAPELIDYLSIDTEGSEFEILNSFDFKKYKFKIITVEHNFTIQREKIHELLNKNGYKRVLTDISRFDDWYVLEKFNN